MGRAVSFPSRIGKVFFWWGMGQRNKKKGGGDDYWERELGVRTMLLSNRDSASSLQPPAVEDLADIASTIPLNCQFAVLPVRWPRPPPRFSASPPDCMSYRLSMDLPLKSRACERELKVSLGRRMDGEEIGLGSVGATYRRTLVVASISLRWITATLRITAALRGITATVADEGNAEKKVSRYVVMIMIYDYFTWGRKTTTVTTGRQLKKAKAAPSAGRCLGDEVLATDWLFQAGNKGEERKGKDMGDETVKTDANLCCGYCGPCPPP